MEKTIYSTGWIDRPDVPLWACGADIIVMPSIDDGMANGLLEGMALGLCPLVTSIFLDIVADKTSGLVITPGDHQQLADSIIYLDDNRCKVDQFGECARKTVQHWTSRDEAISYLEVLTHVIEKEHV